MNQPQLAEQASHWLGRSLAPPWYQEFVQNQLVPNWRLYAHILTATEFLVGISFILGYMVRPFSIAGILLNLNLLWLLGPETAILYQTFIAVHVVLGWLGAGRCLGMDYYFYKRRRGIWW